MSNAYALRSPVFLTGRSFGLSYVRDELSDERKQSVDFHVASDDYFGTLATIMGLVYDALAGDDLVMQERCRKTLDELREEFLYLQENYSIGDK